MPHRYKLSGLPEVSPIEWMTPRRQRAHGAAWHNGALLYRADGGVFSDEADARDILIEDEPGALFIMPFSHGGVVVAQRVVTRTIPPHVVGFAFISRSRTTQVDGHACAVNAQGTHAAVADLTSKTLSLVDLSTGNVRPLCSMDAGMDPLFPPVLDLNADATRVLLTDARTQQPDTSLDVVDVGSGKKTRLMGPLQVPSHVAASFSPTGARICATVMLPGDSPMFRLYEIMGNREPRMVLDLHHTQPFSQPRFLDEQTVVLLCSLQAHPGATYGPVDAVMLRLDGGIPTLLTKTGDLQGTVRVHGASITVEGGRELGIMKVKP